MKTKAFRLYKNGGPKVLKWETVDVPEPGKGEVLIKHTAVGLNLADTYRRTGLYPITLPSGIGNEAVGVVEAVGPGTRGVKIGDRVGYIGGMALDGYSQRRVAPVASLIPIPDFIDDKAAAAALLKGITAQYLLRDSYRVKKGDTIVVHAAAGGVGLIMCQWANAIGATVIGIVSSDEKAKIAARNGCHHPIVARTASMIRLARIPGRNHSPVSACAGPSSVSAAPPASRRKRISRRRAGWVHPISPAVRW